MAFTQAAFGAPVSELATLAAAKAVTIPRIIELLPPGTQNPSYMLYDSPLYSLGGLVVVAAVANSLVRPIAKEHFITKH